MPVIFLSDRLADEQVAQGFREGTDDHIGGPVDLQEFDPRIRAIWYLVAETGARKVRQEVPDESHGLVLDLDGAARSLPRQPPPSPKLQLPGQ